MVGTIYRLKWQVELIFKHWKSLLHLHVLRGTRPQRILCLLYGRFILITILTMISAFVFGYAQSRFKKELSPHKLILWLKRNHRLARAIHHNELLLLLEDLLSQLPKKLSKQKRTRKTTFQLVHERAAYLDSFPNSREVSCLA
ncbi:MAG: transposase [Nitrospira sp.]|nr:transposase [Nitrospira sp.]